MALYELIATAGHADANSFATVAEAEAYARLRIGGAAWLALNDVQKIQTLVTATNEIASIEVYPGLVGDRYTLTQALPFPRGAATLPANLVKATIELAISYAGAFETNEDGTVTEADVFLPPGNGNIKVDTVGPITVEYFGPSSTDATAFERLPAHVQRLLWDLVLMPADGGWGTGTVVRAS